MKFLSAKQARTNLGVEVSKQTFNAKILPLMKAAGDAAKVGNQWIIDASEFWKWSQYARRRRELIESGKWPRSRPWSVDDMETIAYDVGYEDDQSE